MPPLDVEGYYLASRVNATVRPACADHGYRLAGDSLQSPFQLTLDRRLMGLTLKTTIGRAIIFDKRSVAHKLIGRSLVVHQGALCLPASSTPHLFILNQHKYGHVGVIARPFAYLY